jgi:ABC-type multidrug transport system fused ATPase/permease subunit
MATIETIKNTYLKTSDNQFVDKWCGSRYSFISSITTNYTISTTYEKKLKLQGNLYIYEDINDGFYKTFCDLQYFFYLLKKQIEKNEFNPINLYYMINGNYYNDIGFKDIVDYNNNDILYNYVKLSNDLYFKIRDEKDKYNNGNYRLYVETMYCIFTYFVINCNLQIYSEKYPNDDKDDADEEQKIITNKDNIENYLQNFKSNDNDENKMNLFKIDNNLNKIQNTSDKIHIIQEKIKKNKIEIDNYNIENRNYLIILFITIFIAIIYYLFQNIFELSVFIIVIIIIIIIFMNYNIEYFTIINKDENKIELDKINKYLNNIKENSFLKEIIEDDISKEEEKYSKNKDFYERKYQKSKEIINDLLRLNYIIYGLINSILYILIMIIIIDYMNFKESKIIKIGVSIIIIIIFIMLYTIKNNRNFYKKDFVKPM